MASISSWGFAFPRYRIKARDYLEALGSYQEEGVEEKAFPGFDEDETTLAVSAADRALDQASKAGESITSLAIASATDGLQKDVLIEALNAHSAEVGEFGGSSNAGVEALVRAQDIVEGQQDDPRCLVIATNMPNISPQDPAEHGLGSAGIALIVEKEGNVRIGSNLEVIGKDPRSSILRVVRNFLGYSSGSSGGHQKWIISPYPDRSLQNSLIKRGINSSDVVKGELQTHMGDTGASLALLELMSTLGNSRKGDSVFLINSGNRETHALNFQLKGGISLSNPPIRSLTADPAFVTFDHHMKLWESRNDPLHINARILSAQGFISSSNL